jgi:hypothetical protein
MEELAYAQPRLRPQGQAHARASHMYKVFLWIVGEALQAYLTVQACPCRDRIKAGCSHGSALNACTELEPAAYGLPLPCAGYATG